jgi:esterase
MASSLAVTRIAGNDATSRGLVMLHGIYGRGRNWQGIARALVSARPEYACWLVDLPHHGDSGPGAHGDTVAGFAEDVGDWMTSEGIVADAILGHSFGGKVALAFADHARSRPLQVWIIDSTPEARQSSGSAWDMLAIIRRLPPRFAARTDAVEAIVDGGFSLGVAQWMATNLVRDGDEFVWALDFDVMERLLQDFFATDLWSMVEDPVPLHDIHFLKASESSAISPGAVARIQAAAGEHVHLHLRQGGHWIHAESPDVVTALLVKHLR